MMKKILMPALIAMASCQAQYGLNGVLPHAPVDIMANGLEQVVKNEQAAQEAARLAFAALPRYAQAQYGMTTAGLVLLCASPIILYADATSGSDLARWIANNPKKTAAVLVAWLASGALIALASAQ